jgi:hypothetical protein
MKSMETKNKIEQIKGKERVRFTRDGKLVKHFENLIDGATNLKVKEIRFVGVEFDYKKVKIGEEKVNKALREGFQPQRDIVTESGLVLIMVKLDEETCRC